MVLQRSANRFLKSFGSAYAVRDAHGLIGKKFNSLGAARAFARRISLSRRMDNIKFTIWGGRGFSLYVGISYKNGRRGR